MVKPTEIPVKKKPETITLKSVENFRVFDQERSTENNLINVEQKSDDTKNVKKLKKNVNEGATNSTITDDKSNNVQAIEKSKKNKKRKLSIHEENETKKIKVDAKLTGEQFKKERNLKDNNKESTQPTHNKKINVTKSSLSKKKNATKRILRKQGLTLTKFINTKSKQNFKAKPKDGTVAAISDERLRAFGINPKKFHKKIKYGNKPGEQTTQPKTNNKVKQNVKKSGNKWTETNCETTTTSSSPLKKSIKPGNNKKKFLGKNKSK